MCSALLFAPWNCKAQHKGMTWGYEAYLREVNDGTGLEMPRNKWIRGYLSYGVPVIVIALLIYGVVTTFLT